MRRRQGLLQLWPIAAIFAALALPDSTAANAEPVGVWVIGDSIGVGIVGALRRANVPVVAEAQESTNARQWRGMLKWTVSGPAFVVVSLGTNDGVSAELRSEFEQNALAIVEELRQRGHVVCWVLPPSAESLIPTPQTLERLLASGAVVLQKRVAMADKWHPTAAGYDDLAASIESIRRSRT
jgi:lysophospholipase L1-like esterase